MVLVADPRRIGCLGRSGAALAGVAVAVGGRFFPRYYFQLLPLAALAGARGFTLLGGRRALALGALLLVPMVRFGPRYRCWRATSWKADRRAGQISMDHDSRNAAQFARPFSAPGDTFFVWGFRPELYVYTDLPAAARYLDSQPLTGVPADRHLTQSQPVESESTPRAAPNWSALTRRRHGRPGPINPHLAIGVYADLEPWLAQYQEVARTDLTVIYIRK